MNGSNDPQRIPTFTESKLSQAKTVFPQLSRTPQADAVNHPSHYTAGKVECIDALESATTGLQGIEAVCTANAIKYLWRWKRKNGVQDLQKAVWYINHLIEKAKENS